MSNIDWSNVPEDAEFYANNSFRRVDGDYPLIWSKYKNRWVEGVFRLESCLKADDYEKRPEQTKDNVMVISVEREAEIVKEWIAKAIWLHNNTDISFQVWADNELSEPYYNQECVDFIINSYASYKAKEDAKNRQELLDKKMKLEHELAQINKQLGE